MSIWKPSISRPLFSEAFSRGGELIRRNTHGDTRVALRGVGRNRLEVVRGRRSSTTPRDNELSTLGVELRGVGLVESEQLVADEVVARGKVRGDLARPLKGLFMKYIILATQKLNPLPKQQTPV